MPVLTVTVDIDSTPWEDLKALSAEGKLISAMHMEAGTIRVGGLPRGMESGRTSVAIAVPLPDGTVLLTETSLALFLQAAKILEAKYPNG
jgi:hypothetical protein